MRVSKAIKTAMRRMLTAFARRVTLEGTSGTLWRVRGTEDDDGGDLEVFQGIGITARPLDNQAEGILLKLGSGEHRVVISLRDEARRRNVEADETAIHNSVAEIRITKDGDINVIAAAGRTVTLDDGSGAVPLSTLADLQAQVTWIRHQFDLIAGHTHSAAGAGPPITVGSNGGSPTVPPPTPAGTTVARGK